MSRLHNAQQAFKSYADLSHRLARKPRPSAAELAQLTSLRSAAEAALAACAPTQTANATRRAQGKARRAAEQFRLTYDNGRVDHLQGWDAVSRLTGYVHSTLRTRFSNGKGTINVAVAGSVVTITRLGASLASQPS